MWQLTVAAVLVPSAVLAVVGSSCGSGGSDVSGIALAAAAAVVATPQGGCGSWCWLW